MLDAYSIPFDELRRPLPLRSDALETLRSFGPYGRLPPGPLEPPLAQLAEFMLEPLAFQRICRDRFGPTFTVRLPMGPPIVHVSSPDAIRDVFAGSPEEFWGGEANAMLEPIVGPGSVLRLDGERHQRERKLLLPPFRGERMKSYGRTMRDVTIDLAERHPVGTALPFNELTQAITFEVILRAMFGLREGPATEPLRKGLADIIAFGTRPEMLVHFLRFDLGSYSPWGRFLATLRDTRAMLLAVANERRANPDPDANDVLSLLLEARHDDGSPMTDEALLDELFTLVAAGHETTATSLAWVAHRLIEHPEVQERAAAEVRAAFPDGAIDSDRINSLEYLRAVCQETLRMHPIVPVVGRVLQRDATIGGVHLPRGVMVAVSISLAHENPDVYPGPERFRPERFLERRFTAYEHLPFGGGARRCIGMGFASYEMAIVLATLLSRYRFLRAIDTPIRAVRRSVTLAPSDGMPVILALRD